MHPYPHTYSVEATAQPEGDVAITAAGLPSLTTAPPREFDGPGDRWSPETLLCAAVADCVVLSFRAVARASKLAWTSLECGVSGTLDRADGKTRFTRFVINARLVIPPGTDRERATMLMHKAEAICLVSNSLNSERQLELAVDVG